MKISTIALAVLGFIQPSVEANESGCVTTVEQGKDYFPIKSTVENSELWTVTYSDTYKIVTNLALSETYVLYQCGTEVPEDIPNNGTFSVPLEKLGLLSTTYIPFFEMLGARDSIGTFLSPAAWVSSPCMLELFDQGVIGEVENVYNETTLDAETMVLPSFVYSYGGFSTPLSNEIIVSEFEEKSNLAVFEWIKFFALFLNLEEEANEIFAATKSRFECATENAGYLACDDKPKPVVLWGHYSAYCGGWDVATCPNYYCEFASSCQAEIRNPEDRGSVVSEACGANYMTTEEFVAFGKDADVWIYPNNDFDSTLSEFGDAIADFVSVKNEKVFDNLGSGDNAWYEQRLAEPGKFRMTRRLVFRRDPPIALPLP